jgi:hypothetical protein
MIRRSARLLSTLSVPLALLGCSSDPSTGDSKTKSKPATAQTGQAYERVIEGTWTLAPGTENPNFCVKKPITKDTYISAIRPVHPPGTHHTLLTIGDASDNCTTAVLSGFVYAAGLGSEGLVLPKGVALKLPAGKVLNLGLHIYNTSTEELTGTSAMEVVTMDAKDVVYESDSVLAGPLSFNLPAHQVTTVKSDCELTSDQSAWALFPHMHQLGKHIKTTVTIGGVQDVLHDGDYDFAEQYQLPLDPILKLSAGDKITTECTYENTTDHAVTFGESSDTEMCFSVLFRYPKQASGFCTGGSGAASGKPCAAKGAAGNEAGVGKECTKGGGECADNASATTCLADRVPAAFANFCTASCKADADCGEGARCAGSSGSSVCVPEACFPKTTADAGAMSMMGG